MDGCIDVTINGCTLDGGGSTFVYIVGASQRVHINDTSFMNGGGYGINIMSSGNISVGNSVFRNLFDSGIRMMSEIHVHVTSCIFDSCGFAGISIGGTSIRIRDVASHNNSYGIYISGSSDVDIDSSNLSNNRLGLLSYHTTDLRISRTSITDCLEQGFWIIGCSYIELDSIYMNNCSHEGMWVKETSNLSVRGSTFEDLPMGTLHMDDVEGIEINNSTITTFSNGYGISIRSDRGNVTVEECVFKYSGEGITIRCPRSLYLARLTY